MPLRSYSSPSRALLLVAAAATVATAEGRTVQSFNDGWSFFRGELPAWQCSTPDSISVFPIDLTNVQVRGLQSATGPSDTPAACAAQCGCTCQVWQWCNKSSSAPCASSSTSCYTGILNMYGPYNVATAPNSGWVGGARVAPPTAPFQSTGPASFGYDESEFSPVALPHDALATGTPTDSNEEPQQQHGYVPFTNVWYRKSFVAPFGFSLASLNFDGCYRSCTVWLNGALVGHHEEGYTAFHMWLHNASNATLRWGVRNVLAVHVDTTTVNNYKGELWSYEGAGITRPVSLTYYQSPLSIVPWGVFVNASVAGPVSAPNGLRGPMTADSALNPCVDVANAGTGEMSFTLLATVLSGDGAEVAHSEVVGGLPSGGWARVRVPTIALPAASLWVPATSPDGPDAALYTLRVQLNVSGAAVDSSDVPFGIRSVRFDANEGLFVNGFPIHLRGFSVHQDFAGVGAAVPPNLLEYRLQRLLDTGGNAYRTAHNPVDTRLIAAADRRGIMVWEETRFLRQYAPFVADAVDMVLRDRNHPSVIMWSLCNENGCLENEGEEGAPAGRAAGAVVGQTYKDALNAVDGTRPITGNSHNNEGTPGTILDIYDVIGITYDYGSYDSIHKSGRLANTPVMGGESASCQSPRGFDADGSGGYISSYSPVGCVQEAWTAVTSRPWVAGNFAWSLFDYGGESSWPAVWSFYGVMDYAGFAKPSYHWYRSWWGIEAGHADALSRVFFFPEWTLPANQVGKAVRVVVYAAGASVRAFLNGVALGIAPTSMPQLGYVSWPDIDYAPGNLTVVSYAADGAVLGAYTSVTAGAPAALSAVIEWPGSGPSGALLLDGIDVVLIVVSVHDASGRVVPDARNNVTFTIAGPGFMLGAGNGDQLNHLPRAGIDYQPAYAGLLKVIVRGVAGTETSTTLQVTAASEGLQSVTIPVVAVAV